jgi:nitroreductase
MDFFECVESRRSIRAYRADPVEEAKLDRILEAAILAPTAHDNQPIRLVIAGTRGREAALRRVYDKAWFVAAPLFIALCTVPAEAWSRRDGRSYADVDAAIVMDHIVLAATELGLGSCWIANFDPKAAVEVLALEADWEPLLLTPLGYPAESPPPRPRRPLGELVIRR